MIRFLEYRKWRQLFNRYMFLNWKTNDADNIFFAVEGDSYIALDVHNGEVYIEEFKNINDLEEFYETKVDYIPGIQISLF
ncbi:hypothetical protein EVU91_11690 [Macrococcoides bohemicum]|uniref:hypothetical protein n=1 Tax=Macrococcoides bohemicum TaxID=1903056 RepID=UPI00105A70E2|nr:hypothetical protein [Macrococcus bohemicus]TDL35705.1 hypothetical protein EVU91_11690 [Macrococcus bohemicus]